MSQNAKFRRDFAAVLRKAGEKADTVVRSSALAMGTSLVQKSPVDTGRFKGNWMYGAGVPNVRTDGAADRSGGSSITRIQTGLSAWKAGQTIYLANSLPYAKRLEYGWSQQAPSGMVRLTVMEWRQKVAKAAEAVRNA